MTAVDAALAELRAALAALDPMLEGLTDFLSVDDLLPETKAALQGGVTLYQRRQAHLQAAIMHLEDLLEDGYPDLDLPPVTPTVDADLQTNLEGMQAARGLFLPDEPAAALNPTLSPPEPK